MLHNSTNNHWWRYLIHVVPEKAKPSDPLWRERNCFNVDHQDGPNQGSKYGDNGVVALKNKATEVPAIVVSRMFKK